MPSCTRGDFRTLYIHVPFHLIPLFLFLFFRNFRKAVHCSNVAQNSHCKFKRDVAYIIKDSYNSFCINGSEKETGGSNVSGASYNWAGFVSIIFSLVLHLVHARNLKF